MGLLVDGQWVDQWYDTKASGGKFVRSQSQFRHWLTADGSAGPSGDAGFKAEAGRYHLYVSLACPWAHRTLIFRALKGLETMISVSVVHHYMAEDGWTFKTDNGGPAAGDDLFGFDFMHQVYTKADPNYSGRVTVPVLWDKKHNTIVSNESSEIIRMLNSAFDGIGAKAGDYWPEALHDEIEAVNERIYHDVNNGVYKSGFATSTKAYEEAFDTLFASLDWLEERLSQQRYLVGSQITEADWRLFTTLIRFDAVYVSHFKTNRNRIQDMPHLSNYMRELYQMAGVKETVDMTHIKHHYFASHDMINPTRIVPKGPMLDFDAPHDRDRFSVG